jgi:hypothetical protein
MRTRPPFLRAVLFTFVATVVAGTLYEMIASLISDALKSHRKLFWTCLSIATLAIVGYELWRNKAGEGDRSPSVYPAVKKKKDAEQRLRIVGGRIKELTDRTGEAAIRNPRQWLSRWKLKRLQEEIKNLNKEILKHDEHLLNFGGGAAEKLQELLALAGCDLVPGTMDRLNTGKAQFYVEEAGDFQKRRRLLVHYLPREAGLADIQELEQAIITQQVDHGWLIAEKLNPGSQIEPGTRIRFFKPEELFNELFDLRPYFEWLQRKCADLNVTHHNVAMEGNIPTYDREGNEASSAHILSLDDHITQWLDRDGLNNILLLGDFGTGKTWFCLQYANKQLAEFLKRPRQNRIPILIHLGEFKAHLKQMQSGVFGEPDQLLRIFCEIHGIDRKKFELFDTFNKQGRFLLILDGLDEIVSDPSELAATCGNLSKFGGGKSKMLLTSRRTLFKTSEERQNLFGLHNFFEVIWLDKLDPDKIKVLIKSYVGNRWRVYWQKISGMRNLADLEHRTSATSP